MKVTDLQPMLDKHLLDKNYQHRDKTWVEIDKLAAQSFSRLTETSKKKIFKVCAKFGLTDNVLIHRAR